MEEIKPHVVLLEMGCLSMNRTILLSENLKLNYTFALNNVAFIDAA
jgi:hypothetical protein